MIAIVTVMSLAAGDIQFVWTNVYVVVLVSVIIRGGKAGTLEHWNNGVPMRPYGSALYCNDNDPRASECFCLYSITMLASKMRLGQSVRHSYFCNTEQTESR